MKIQQLYRSLLPLLAITVFASVANAKIVRQQNETIDLNGIESVEINVSAGNINIVGSDRSDLQFDLDKIYKTNSESEADEIDEQIVRSIKRKGDTLVIKVEYKPESSFWKSLMSNGNGVNFNADLELPRNLEAIAHTNGGNVDARNLEGDVNVKTNGGNIEVANSTGNVAAHTNGGNIKVIGLSGEADLHTNGGNIEVKASSAAIAAHTNGGNIRADFQDGVTGRTRMKTNGGSITVRMPENYGFELDAEAHGGGVQFTYDGTLKGEIKNHKIDAIVNGGGPLLSLATQGGRVHVTNL